MGEDIESVIGKLLQDANNVVEKAQQGWWCGGVLWLVVWYSRGLVSVFMVLLWKCGYGWSRCVVLVLDASMFGLCW